MEKCGNGIEWAGRCVVLELLGWDFEVKRMVEMLVLVLGFRN